MKSGGVCLSSSLSFHLCKLVVCVRGRNLSSVAQRREHKATRNIKVVRITTKLDGRPEGKHVMMKDEGQDEGERASSGCR
jgi:hypothetical protein